MAFPSPFNGDRTGLRWELTGHLGDDAFYERTSMKLMIVQRRIMGRSAQLKFLPEMLAIFTLSRCLIRTMTEAIKNFLFGRYQEIVVFLSTPSVTNWTRLLTV